MNDVKAWYKSRTVWGALIAISASLAHAAGVEVTTGEEGELADLIVAAFGAPARDVNRVRHSFAIQRGSFIACITMIRI